MSSLMVSRILRIAPAGLAGVVALALASCSDEPSTAPEAAAPLFAGGGGGSSNGNAWKIPLAASGLALRSDGLKSDGTYSVYADGVCNVDANIFYGSGSGDATLRVPNTGSCKRTITLVYPDAFSETVPSFNNLNILENSSYQIPIGATVPRRLIIGPQTFTSRSRCGRVLFGPNGSVSPGTDSVLVTRVDASTWQVQSQAAPNDRALCETTGAIYEMPVSFVIVSGTPLP